MKSKVINISNDQTNNGQKIPQYNRSFKRKIAKIYNIPMSKIDEMFAAKIKDIIWEKLPEGTKVKLKYDRIMENKKDLGEKYIEWITEHKDQVMTVYQDEQHQDSDLYCMREDTNISPWLFDISDLEIVEFKDGQQFEAKIAGSQTE